MKDNQLSKRNTQKQLRKRLERGDYSRIEKLTGYSYKYIEKMFAPTPERPLNDLVIKTAQLIIADRKASDRRIKQQLKEWEREQKQQLRAEKLHPA